MMGEGEREGCKNGSMFWSFEFSCLLVLVVVDLCGVVVVCVWAFVILLLWMFHVSNVKLNLCNSRVAFFIKKKLWNIIVLHRAVWLRLK